MVVSGGGALVVMVWNRFQGYIGTCIIDKTDYKRIYAHSTFRKMPCSVCAWLPRALGEAACMYKVCTIRYVDVCEWKIWN